LGGQFETAGDKLIEELGKTGLYGDRPYVEPKRAAAKPAAAKPAAAAAARPTPVAAPAAAPVAAPVSTGPEIKFSGGRVRRKQTTTTTKKRMGGRGLTRPSPSWGYGLYAGGGLYAAPLGGGIIAPANFIPPMSAVMSPLVDIGNAQWGQHIIPIPL
jgi:hypothetical protein